MRHISHLHFSRNFYRKGRWYIYVFEIDGFIPLFKSHRWTVNRKIIARTQIRLLVLSRMVIYRAMWILRCNTWRQFQRVRAFQFFNFRTIWANLCGLLFLSFSFPLWACWKTHSRNILHVTWEMRISAVVSLSSVDASLFKSCLSKNWKFEINSIFDTLCFQWYQVVSLNYFFQNITIFFIYLGTLSKNNLI